MTALRSIGVAAIVLALAACGQRAEQTYQGWVEADFIYVSPGGIRPPGEARSA